MKKILIQSAAQWEKFLNSSDKTLDINITQAEELFNFDLVNQNDLSYLEYINQLSPNDEEDFQETAVRTNTYPSSYPCLLMVFEYLGYNEPKFDWEFVYQSDFMLDEVREA